MMMILTDRIKSLACTGKPPEGALDEVRKFYETTDDIPESYGTVIQYWAVNDTHFFVVMIDRRCDCLRVFKSTNQWHLSVDSQTEFIEDDPT